MYCSNTERPGEFVKLFPGTASSQAVPKAAVQVDGKRKYVCRKHVNLQDRAFDERRDCTPGRLTHERQKILHFAKNYYCLHVYCHSKENAKFIKGQPVAVCPPAPIFPP